MIWTLQGDARRALTRNILWEMDLLRQLDKKDKKFDNDLLRTRGPAKDAERNGDKKINDRLRTATASSKGHLPILPIRGHWSLLTRVH